MKPAEILRELSKFPQKRFGQNFLVDDKALQDIVETGDLSPSETVVEVGPGLGALTNLLAQKVSRVIAVEADGELAEYLRRHTPKHVTVITGDALRIDWTVDLKNDEPYKIVANIPYSITSPLVRKILSLDHKPDKVVLLVQKEVAERITAKPGASNRGFLTLLLEAGSTVRICRTVKPGSFYPMPKVDSAVIEITPFRQTRIEEVFWPAVETAFRHKRQTLANSLTNGLRLPKATSEELLIGMGLNPMIRPAELSFDQWVELSNRLKEVLK